MKTVKYNDQLKYDQPEQEAQPDMHALLVEIAERLHEMGQRHPTVVTHLWRAVYHILRDSDSAFWLLWDALRPLSVWRSTSYSKLAANRGCTKQAVHQRLESDLEVIALRRPDLAEIVREKIGRGKKKGGGPLGSSGQP